VSEESTISQLPGYELYLEGMEALRKGDWDTVAAQLLMIATTRLGKAGLPIPPHSQNTPAHLVFYRLLANQYPDAHYRYNASLQRLDKFCRAVERQRYS
jgi:outer membrane protein assembly factor BamD (BamD/ComL family)